MIENEIRIWQLNIADFTDVCGDFQKLLPPGDIKRVEDYYFLKDKQSFIIRRGILYLLLNRYLKIKPDNISLVYSETGKPFLPDYANFYFNLSHSTDRAVFIFSDNPVGIDIEYIRDMDNFDDMAKISFSVDEYKKISSLSGINKKKLFFDIWTKRESVLKANGAGFSLINELRLQSMPSGDPLVVDFCKTKWFIRTLFSVPDYAISYASTKNIEAEIFSINKNNINSIIDFR